MKYIRTKDKIYGGNGDLETAVKYFEETLKEKVIKTADNVEELFDLYIVVANGFPFQFANKPTEILFAKSVKELV